jgi:hypothetical protein
MVRQPGDRSQIRNKLNPYSTLSFAATAFSDRAATSVQHAGSLKLDGEVIKMKA